MFCPTQRVGAAVCRGALCPFGAFVKFSRKCNDRRRVCMPSTPPLARPPPAESAPCGAGGAGLVAPTFGPDGSLYAVASESGDIVSVANAAVFPLLNTGGNPTVLIPPSPRPRAAITSTHLSSPFPRRRSVLRRARCTCAIGHTAPSSAAARTVCSPSLCASTRAGTSSARRG